MYNVFVYGSLKKGFGNHYFLNEAKFLKEDSVNGFVMVSLGGFPGAIRGEGTIHGELYEVNEQQMRGLNSLEGYSEIRPKKDNFYDREFVKTNSGEEAYIYTLEAEYLKNPLVEDGIWKKEKRYSCEKN